MQPRSEDTFIRDNVTQGGTLVLKESVKLPEVLDVLIVGAGPAGTAAAFRAKELNLSVLVIDRDDVLAILRDWMSPEGREKDKKVDSSYGPAGKRVPFPAGDDLVAQLVFGDQVPASDLFQKWISVYIERSIPAKIGLDFTGLSTRPDGVLSVKCTNQRTREEVVYLARHLVLAMGRGVPIKLDIPGDTTGICYKLKETQAFVGGPACVIGGGTSAAEAVIAVSNAKVAAGDDTDVIWAYRKRKLPKVNTTLAEVFFKAYAGNGNIRYVPLSEPLAVLKGSEGAEFVALRTDRRELPGRPPEGVFLEFPKERILACIGADLPVQFLSTLGVHRLKNADDEEELMAVSPIFESEIRNVYLAGDLLSPAFIQTTDFRRDAVQTTVLDHTGNFKQGMIDGVLIVEGIHQRKLGKKDEDIVQHLNKKRSEFEALHRERLSKEDSKAAEKVEVAAPGKETAAKPPPPTLVGAKFAWVVQADGQKVEKEEKTFATGRVVIGKSRGDLTFPEDDLVTDDHVAIDVYPDASYVSGEGMKGAAYVDVKGERAIQQGDAILAGDQSLRIESTQFGPVLAVLDPGKPEARPLNLIPIREGANVFGRGNLTPEAKDMRLSRRHFSLQLQGNVLTLRDFGSRNGTFIPVTGTIRLNLDDELCFGTDRRMRFKGMETGAGPAAAVAPPPPKPAEAQAAKPAAQAAAPARAAAAAAPAKPAEAKKAPAGGPSVAIANKEFATTFATNAELTLLEKLIELGMATDKRAKLEGKCQTLWSCKSGNCGLCVIKVVGGADSLSKAAGKEKRTLKTMVDALNQDQNRSLDPNACRLACVAKVTGPVEVELLGDTDASD